MALKSPRFNRSEQLIRASDNNPPLNGGTQGEGVRLLQQALIDSGFPMPISIRRFGSPDGIYGRETKDAVRGFQRQHKLSPDGIAGRGTMAKLDELFPGDGEPLPPLPGLKYTHRVKLHFRSIANPVVSEFNAIRNAQLVFRQYGIDFSFASGMSLLISSDQTVILDDVDAGTCLMDGPESSEQSLLFGLGSLQGVAPNDISVFYVNRAAQSDGTALAGCATSSGAHRAVLVAAAGSRWTLGHEVCHVMLDKFRPTHSTDPTNLMFVPTASITANPPTLTPEQLVAIKASRWCQSIA